MQDFPICIDVKCLERSSAQQDSLSFLRPAVCLIDYLYVILTPASTFHEYFQGMQSRDAETRRKMGERPTPCES